jgi:bacteriorhodopsin
MSNLLSISLVSKMLPTDYVGFTFFIGCMAMMAASAFFFLSLSQFDKKWRVSVLVSGLITFIAAVHYFYMRDYWASFGESPTFFRYVDWVLTVPLMCLEFYLILKIAGAKQSLLWKMIIYSLVMLVTGYFGEAVDPTNAWLWGLISGLAYFAIVYEIWLGDGWYTGLLGKGNVDVAYNIADAINKIGFGLVIYNLAVKSTKE